MEHVLKNAISGIDFQTVLFYLPMSLYFNRKKDKDNHSLIKLSLIKVLKASYASGRKALVLIRSM